MLVTEDASGPDIPDPEKPRFPGGRVNFCHCLCVFVSVIVIVFLMAVTTEDTSVPDIRDPEKPVQTFLFPHGRVHVWFPGTS